MVFQRTVIQERLKELQEILRELSRYRDVTLDEFQLDLSQRWIIERGLIAAASIVFDIADHILAGHFGHYVETYESGLEALRDRDVISKPLYAQIRGLGGFRNILVHRYLRIDPRQVMESFEKGLSVFPRFAQEILSWIDGLEVSDVNE